MIEANAAVPTVHGAKYLKQLCNHWAHKLDVEQSDGAGRVRFPAAAATMRAEAERLIVTIGAEDEATLERMKSVLATHLDRFAFREAPLAFDWKPGR
jgi:hypothetical protein